MGPLGPSAAWVGFGSPRARYFRNPGGPTAAVILQSDVGVWTLEGCGCTSPTD